ncbi:UDP-N-acetylmuramoyl-L-alanyl-D-glutamate--2,6-diaminopimelate ligase [bacterium]|nr:UDP-N-acetylmuramoyl-L-alanyl-D-glutamate--2,6-diaminopimelate ligase [bacterium]NUN46531.1 UDP-N-acetylmuramoyl-L-alanyl-D-glutamate--2,6-diaminopimelate ligase [bacterium]
MKKTLREILNNNALVRNVYGSTSLTVTGLCTDSRFAQKDNIFYAIRGTQKDGNKFIAHAIQKGASVIVSDELYAKVQFPPKTRVTYVQVENLTQFMAESSASFYGTTNAPMAFIGITGTNGKTTTAKFINETLKALGHKTVFLGTTGFEVCGRIIPTDFTTPPAPMLHKYLREGMDKGATHVVMEVSSHALKLKRVWGLRFDAAVFTNLTHEHRELHASMDDYFSTKALLFSMLKPIGFAVINGDDDFSGGMRKSVPSGHRIVEYGKKNSATLRLEKIKFNPDSRLQTIVFVQDGKSAAIETRMIGEFNAYNALAAYGVLEGLGLDMAVGAEKFPTLPTVDGRFNWYKAGTFNVIIDFAHTPDGLEKLLQEVNRIKPQGRRLITVFGCPGSRDPSKRPMMGKIATTASEHTIITTDDIHHESPEAIIQDITRELSGTRHEIIIDRREAIRRSLQIAQEGDFVVIAGRGHERYQYVGDEKIPFYDRQVFMEEAQKIELKVEE